MQFRFYRFAALALLPLAGCVATAPTVPAGYTGPIAYVRDIGKPIGAGRAEVFYVVEIDGRAIHDSAAQTRKNSAGQGRNLSLSMLTHTVPAGRMRLKIVAQHATAAPIEEMAMRARDQYREVAREVEFTPKPNGRYRVSGSLQTPPQVWIEDEATGERVTP